MHSEVRHITLELTSALYLLLLALNIFFLCYLDIDLNLPRYKYMVQVVITENKGAGMRMGARCLWDSKTDSATEAIYVNNHIICCVSIFAIYIY